MDKIKSEYFKYSLLVIAHLNLKVQECDARADAIKNLCRAPKKLNYIGITGSSNIKGELFFKGAQFVLQATFGKRYILQQF